MQFATHVYLDILRVKNTLRHGLQHRQCCFNAFGAACQPSVCNRWLWDAHWDTHPAPSSDCRNLQGAVTWPGKSVPRDLDLVSTVRPCGKMVQQSVCPPVTACFFFFRRAQLRSIDLPLSQIPLRTAAEAPPTLPGGAVRRSRSLDCVLRQVGLCFSKHLY